MKMNDYILNRMDFSVYKLFFIVANISNFRFFFYQKILKNFLHHTILILFGTLILHEAKLISKIFLKQL